MRRSVQMMSFVVILGGLFIAGGCGPQKNLALNVAARHGTKDDMERALATGKEQAKTRMFLRRRDGDELPVETSAAPFFLRSLPNTALPAGAVLRPRDGAVRASPPAKHAKHGVARRSHGVPRRKVISRFTRSA